ncbi:L-ascorbate metabolism protein UlaG (beta-lactamase superfamily) [Micromonospora sp. HB375]|uniref:MBL fold metallo-hydrolase n=2 Tax=Micromonosporaceae TaxID=28056 RepID=UPI001AE62B5D|nr:MULTISPECIES: MBL fold metallo-hydrolase [unclassified Micromonospora]MBP1783434.1 L-ascorbate metabolism protein UlaG (beta-lactamase superfamily) [Micromonospora sp. HB375]MDH6469083.1 L-ascorbate metabolism protein UlaG (beta-lactamase superfamily) [Micromonospora sp. H404/HB375]
MDSSGTSVEAIFFGTTTVWLSDGTSGILIDGFLSRPSLLRVAFGRVAPDLGRITSALARAGVTRLDALFVAHSHYDHAMDAPEVVKHLGGRLFGSESTLNVGRGAGLAEESMTRIADGGEHTVGAFTVRVLAAVHSPGNRFPGTIDEPLVPPVRASSYRDGGCFSFLITHPGGSLLIHPSANFVPGKFDGLDVDVLYLATGALGVQPRRFQDDYWRHVVEATRPGLIVPIHWDNFFVSLDRRLRPLPPVFDRFAVTKAFLDRRSAEARIPVRFPEPFEVTRLFAR